MDRERVIEILDEIGTILELEEANPFEIMAYRNGARSLAEWDGDLRAMVEEGTLTRLEGIGKGLAQLITDLVRDGRSEIHETKRARFPMGLLDVKRVPNLGTKKVLALHRHLGIDSLEALENAAREGHIRELDGFGARTEERILEGIARIRGEL